MCTCKDKTVDTIFYFAPTKAEYNALYISNEIDARTITFVAETGEIWKNGVLYGKMSELDFKDILEKIFRENPYVLPIATKDDADNAHIGGVMGGKYITVNTKNGSISIDINKLFSDPTVKNLIEKVITQELIENKYTPAVADYDKLGIVSVKRDGGITIKNGVISIDGDNLPDGLQGKDGATPTIGSDGYWYINGKNTGVKAKGEKGEKGDAGTGGGVSGRYIVNIIYWYCLSNDKTAAPTSGWTTTPQEVDENHLYLWCKEQLVYNDGTSSWTIPHLANQWVKGDRGETGPGGGFNPHEDTYIQEIYNLAYNNYLLGQSLIDGEITRVLNLVNAIDEEIQQRVVNMLDEAGVIQNGPQGLIQPVYTFGMEDVDTWLAQLGFWDFDANGNRITKWSKIQQLLGDIELSTSVLREFTNDQIQALQSFLRVFSDENEAGHELASFLADLNDQQLIVRWLYSGITGKAIEGKTWEDMISAARDVRTGQAASNLHTEIELGLDGSFVSKGSLTTLVENTLHTKLAAAGIISQSQDDWALSETFSRVQDVFENDGYADLNAMVLTISDMLDGHNPYTQALMIADTSIYEILTEPVTKDGKTCIIPKLDENGNIQYVYEDSLWVITNEDGWASTLNGKPFTYPKDAVVDRDPGMYGERKKKLKANMTAGIMTYSDADKALAQLFAEDKMDGTKAEIRAIVAEGQSEVVIEADQITHNGNSLFNGDGEFIGDVNANSFTAGEQNGIHIKTQGDQIQFVKGEEVVGYFEIAEADNSYGLQLYLKKAGETGYYHVNWDNWTSDTLRRWVNAGYYLVQAAGKIGNSWLSPVNPKFPNIVTNERLTSIYNMILGTGSLSPVKQYLTSDPSESYINDTYNTVQDKNSTYPWFVGIPSSGTQWNKYTTLSDLNGVIRADIEQTVVQSIEALGYTTEDLSSSSNDLSIINIHESDNTLTDPIYVIHAQLVTASGAQDIIGLANESKLLSLI